MDLLKNDETPVSKDLLKQIIDMLYGTIWSRTEQLSLQERSMITLTVLVALNRENELKSHLRGAKNLGITKEKIEEMQRKLEEEYGEANSYVMDLQEQIDQTDFEKIYDFCKVK